MPAHSFQRCFSSFRSPGLLVTMVLSLFLVWGCQSTPPKEKVNEKKTEVTREATPDEVQPEPIREPAKEPVVEQDAGTPEPEPPEVIEKQEVLKATTVVPLQKPSKRWNLPASLQASKNLSLAPQADLSILLGSSKGLYQLKANKITKVSERPIVAMTPWKDGITIVAESKVIYRYESGLQSTQLADSLENSPILSLAPRTNGAFWIGTQAALWLLANDTLSQLQGFQGASRLVTVAGKEHVYGKDHKGQPFALQKSAKGEWQLLYFQKEKKELVQVYPANDKHSHFWGLDNKGHLWLRKVDGDNAAWWPFRIKPDQDNAPTIQITQLVLNKKTGKVWAYDGARKLYRMDEVNIAVQELPKELTKAIWISTDLEGVLWLSDGKSLFRLGESGPAISYKKQIEPFMKKHCLKCHTSSGVGRRFPLETYEQVKKLAAKVLQQVELSKMPPGNPLGKTETMLLQNWIAGGTQP